MGPARAKDDSLIWDTMHAQIERNGDAGKRLLVKVDVEGAEWPSFLATPDSALNGIDQLVVEFHGVDGAGYADVMRKLNRIFHLVDVHFNNWVCDPAAAPFAAPVFEVLMVNKSIGVVDPAAPAVIPNPFDSPNNRELPDCQLPADRYPTAPTATTESKSLR